MTAEQLLAAQADCGHRPYRLAVARVDDIVVYRFTYGTYTYGACWARVICTQPGAITVMYIGRCTDGCRFCDNAPIGTCQTWSVVAEPFCATRRVNTE